MDYQQRRSYSNQGNQQGKKKNQSANGVVGSLKAKYALKGVAFKPASDADVRKYGANNAFNEKKHQEGVEKLKKLEEALLKERKKKKQDAIDALAKDPKNIALQDNVASAIKASHATYGDFENRAKKEFSVQGKEIWYLGQLIAELYDGNDAVVYEQVEDAISEDCSPVYKRITLNGLSQKEYVKINGAMLRRYANRGITPPENSQYLQENNLVPINSGEKITQITTGHAYGDDGTSFVRSAKANNAKKPAKSDGEFIKELGVLPTDSFPEEMLAFTQLRNGVGKVFSGTSTSKQITSNHGASFNKYGVITIDLARVPQKDILYHYNVQAFDEVKVKAMVQKINQQILAKKDTQKGAPKINDVTIKNHVRRGNLSAIRNREILFRTIPYKAVTAYQPSENRTAYINKYRQEFKSICEARAKQCKKQIPAQELDEYIESKLANYGDRFTANRASKDAEVDAEAYLEGRDMKKVVQLIGNPAKNTYNNQGGRSGYQKKGNTGKRDY